VDGGFCPRRIGNVEETVVWAMRHLHQPWESIMAMRTSEMVLVIEAANRMQNREAASFGQAMKRHG